MHLRLLAWGFCLASSALASCTPAPRAVAPPPTSLPSPLFEPYPVDEIAHVRDPHDYKGKALCQRCHFPDGKLVTGPSQVCTACHRFGHGNHPVDVVQRTEAKGLPLLEGGKVACHTCHDPHQRKSVLRMPFNELCTTCHTSHR